MPCISVLCRLRKQHYAFYAHLKEGETEIQEVPLLAQCFTANGRVRIQIQPLYPYLPYSKQ